ncbi:MAG TPA: prepilin peptidase [Tepidiformaceae bacterium]|nr:prepilin peptidase [Tepidiformaceae bacterium]HNO65276.1 prepilin peptidase [Tepidiformaceae bacterium]
MDALVMVLAGLLGAGVGASLPLWQHRLYSEPEFRAAPVSGRKRLALQAFDTVAGAAALTLAFRPGGYGGFAAAITAGFLLVLLALASTDFDRRRIPNLVTYPAAAAAVALCWVWPDRTVAEIAIGAGAAVAAAAALGFMRFGGGDLKLIVLMGLLLGWRGLLPALLYGFILGGLVALPLMVRYGRKHTFAYGPYLAIGTAIVLLFPSIA